MITEKIVRERITDIIKWIPDFIDTKYKDHHTIYECITSILKLYNICIVKHMLSNESINELSMHYYSYLLTMHNTNQDLYKSGFDYVSGIYDNILQDLEANDLFEASYNLYHMVNIGTVIDENINENERE